ncbi:MAG: hypothetical protein HYU41_17075 [Candidatus Rokubacteria bacterium]|nr:hypothetical protein [Candidatus Rokubacteria bacterium]
MMGVGVIAIVAGLWLCGIIANLLMLGQCYDIALRDLGLALGAFALSRLAMTVDRRRVDRPVAPGAAPSRGAAQPGAS